MYVYIYIYMFYIVTSIIYVMRCDIINKNVGWLAHAAVWHINEIYKPRCLKNPMGYRWILLGWPPWKISMSRAQLWTQELCRAWLLIHQNSQHTIVICSRYIIVYIVDCSIRRSTMCTVYVNIYIYYIYIHTTAILPTDACCPDIYIEDVILSNMIRVWKLSEFNVSLALDYHE